METCKPPEIGGSCNVAVGGGLTAQREDYRRPAGYARECLNGQPAEPFRRRGKFPSAWEFDDVLELLQLGTSHQEPQNDIQCGVRRTDIKNPDDERGVT